MKADRLFTVEYLHQRRTVAQKVQRLSEGGRAGVAFAWSNAESVHALGLSVNTDDGST